MLKQAILYKNELNNIAASIADDPRYKYYVNWPYRSMTCEVKSSNENEHQYVSVSNGQKILGYLTATISSPTRSIENISLASFENKYSPEFMNDTHEFFIKLFCYFNYSKICWSVIDSSPHMKSYDRICKVYGGVVVGTFKNDKMICDGTIHGEKWYEIMREDFLEAIKDNKRADKIIKKIHEATYD